jgi:hypothetical protein
MLPILIFCLILVYAIFYALMSPRRFVGGGEMPSVSASRGILSERAELPELLEGAKTLQFTDEIKYTLDIPAVSPMTNHTYVSPNLSQFTALVIFAKRVAGPFIIYADTTLPAATLAKLIPPTPIILISPKYVENYEALLPLGETLLPKLLLTEEITPQMVGLPFISTSHDSATALALFAEIKPKAYSLRWTHEEPNWPEGRHRIVPFCSREGEFYTEDCGDYPLPTRGQLAYYNYIYRPYGWHDVQNAPSGIDHCGDCAGFMAAFAQYVSKFTWVMSELSADLWSIYAHGNYLEKISVAELSAMQNNILKSYLSDKYGDIRMARPLSSGADKIYQHAKMTIMQLKIQEDAKSPLIENIYTAMLYGHKSVYFDYVIKHIVSQGDYALAESLALVVSGLLNRWSENVGEDLTAGAKLAFIDDSEKRIYAADDLPEKDTTHVWSLVPSIKLDLPNVSHKCFLFDKIPAKPPRSIIILNCMPRELFLPVVKHFTQSIFLDNRNQLAGRQIVAKYTDHSGAAKTEMITVSSFKGAK